MPNRFHRYLAAEVGRIARREKLPTEKAFLFWFSTTILELSDDDAREAISIDGANDKGIDVFWVDDDEGRVIIAQGKYSQGFQFHPKMGQVTKLESSINWLSSPEALRKEGKPDLAQAAEDYLKAVRDGYGVELWFVYAGPKCQNVDKHISVYNQNPEHINSRRAFRHYHIDLLSAMWEELEGESRRIDSGTISMVQGKSLPFQGPFGQALVVSAPATEIVRLYEAHEERLFDRNVRLFLGVRKGSVNAGIAETLRDKSECLNFWAYNNGLTLICDEFKIDGSTVHLTNFSIVNGCQTAVSLAQGPKENAAGVSVLVKIIAASAEIVDEVIRFTNSQNPIRTWDIASQDRTQRRLKNDFSNLSKPYIYLTRRGSRPKGDLRRYRDAGKLRQIKIDLVGQYAAAFRGRPVLAYKHKAFVFSRYHDDVFPPDARVEEVLFEWLCGEVAREAVQEAISRGKEDDVRVLKKGGTLFVTAAMGKVLSLRNGGTYMSGATEAAITSKNTNGRLKKYADYSRGAYIQAVLDQEQIEKAELPTLIRSPEFHSKVAERIERSYEKDASASKWLAEALPLVKLR